MHKVLLTIIASIAAAAAGLVTSGAQANEHHKPRHHASAHPSSDITSFSSSSGLHVGVNHPPKNR